MVPRAPLRASLILLAFLNSHGALLGTLVSRRPPKTERVRAYWKQDDSALSQQLMRMLEATPSLEYPTYQPTTWAKSSKANFALALVRSRLGELRRKVEPPLTGGSTGRFSACDEPDVTVEWAKDDACHALPPDAPIVVFLHTITGTAAQTRWLTSGASERGWRSCVFVRRGHGGQKLSSPSFNLLGDVGDVELQLAAVKRAFPRASFVGMIGISAGSGLLISYLGRAGAATPVGAACAICPAWDVSTAFTQIGATQPVAERSMLAQIRSRLLMNARPAATPYPPARRPACPACPACHPVRPAFRATCTGRAFSGRTSSCSGAGMPKRTRRVSPRTACPQCSRRTHPSRCARAAPPAPSTWPPTTR